MKIKLIIFIISLNFLSFSNQLICQDFLQQIDSLETEIILKKGSSSIIAKNIYDIERYFRLFYPKCSNLYLHDILKHYEITGDKKILLLYKSIEIDDNSLKYEYPGAVKKIQELLRISAEVKDSFMLSKAYGLMANISLQASGSVFNGSDSLALLYAKTAYKIAEDSRNIKAIYNARLILSKLYSNHNDSKNAIKLLNENLKLVKQSFIGLDKIKKIITLNYNFGNVFQNLSTYSQAISYFNASLKNAFKLDYKRYLFLNYSSIGYCYLKINDLERSQINYNQAIALSKMIVVNNDKKLHLLKEITELNQKLGSFENAFNYSQEYIHLKDSLVDVKNAKDFSALQIKFNNLTHQFKIEKLNQENQQYQLKMRNMIFFIMLLLVIIVVVILLLRAGRKLRIKEHEILTQKEQMFSLISHDIRGPILDLMYLLNYLKNAINLKDLDKLNLYFSGILSTVSNLYTLNENSFNWLKLNLNRFNFEYTLFDLEVETLNIIKMFEHQLSAKNLNVIVSKAQNDVNITSDRLVYTSVVRNMITNAYNYCPENGEIKIEIKKSIDQVLITFYNSGDKINEDLGKNLFRNQLTNEEITKYSSGGKGIGLYLCYQIVHKMGGKITFENVKNGVEFYLRLPNIKLV